MSISVRFKGTPRVEADGGIEQLSGSEIDFGGTKYKFDTVLPEDASERDVYEAVVKHRLAEAVSGKEDFSALVFGAATSGSSHTMFGTKPDGKPEGIAPRAVLDVLASVDKTRMASFKAMSRQIGPGLVDKGETSAADGAKAGAIGVTMSIFELHNDKMKDLLHNVKLPQRADAAFVRNSKDGKMSPAGLTQHRLSDSDQALQLLNSGFQRRRSAADCVIHLNIYGFRRFSRVECTRVTLVDLAGDPSALNKHGLSKFLAGLESSQIAEMRSTVLYKLVLSGAVKPGKPNVAVLMTLDKFSEASRHWLETLFAAKKAATQRAVPVASAKELTEKLEKLKLELDDTRTKNFQLESKNNVLVSTLARIEQDTRLEVSNKFEKMLEEINTTSMTAKLQDDELNQLTTDLKLEKLSLHYNQEIENLQTEKASLKIKLENLQYQNTRMDELFHTEVQKVSDEVRQEYEQKFEQEMKAAREEQIELSDSNALLAQKVGLLQSQLNSYKEKLGTRTDEAAQMYSKIKSMRLEDEVMALIDQKLKSQLKAERRSPVKRKSAALGALGGASPVVSNFKIFEDEPKTKRKLVRKESTLHPDASDTEIS